VGFVNIYPDEDGIIRHTPLKLNNRFSFGLELARHFLEVPDKGMALLSEKSFILDLPKSDRIIIPLDNENRMLVNFPGRTEDWQWLHFVQILMAFMEKERGDTPSIDLNLFKDKIVIIGATHTGLPDIVETPFGSSSYGVEFHASVVNSILERNFICPVSSWASFLIYLIITLVTASLVQRFLPLKGGIVSVSVLICFIGISYVLFSKFHIWLKVVRPVMGFAAVYLTGLVYHFVAVQKAFAELLNQEGYLKNIFESIPCGVFIIDPDRRVKTLNNVMERTFGISKAETINKRGGEALRCINAFKSQEGCGYADECRFCQVRNTAMEALAGKQIHRAKAKVQLLVNGEVSDFVLLVSASPIEYDGENLAIIILEDITELDSLRHHVPAAERLN
jgi:PAS domain-containing protein